MVRPAEAPIRSFGKKGTSSEGGPRKLCKAECSRGQGEMKPTKACRDERSYADEGNDNLSEVHAGDRDSEEALPGSPGCLWNSQ